MTVIEYSGYHSKRTCQAIQRLMNGETFMRFDVGYSNEAGNCTLFVCTDREGTSEKELRDMFTHCLLSKLASFEEV